MKKTLFAGALAILSLVGCGNDFSNARSAIEYSPPNTVQLPYNASYAEKRGFGDMNGDGLTDMVEIIDDKFIGTDYKAKIFYGQNENGLLTFASGRDYDINVKVNWFSSQTKFDIADINGDGFADITFTQYKKGIFSDTYDISVSINDKEGGFKYATSCTKNNVPLGVGLLRVFEAMNDDYENIHDYFKMDWEDMNGDGKADIVFLSRNDSGELFVETWLSNSDKQNVSFYDGGEAVIYDFMWNTSASLIDVEDVTGDGKSDIIVYKTHWGDSMTLRIAENTTRNRFSFVKHKESKITEIEMNWVGFEKRDGVDMNFDGKTDYIHAGNRKGGKWISYNLVK